MESEEGQGSVPAVTFTLNKYLIGLKYWEIHTSNIVLPVRA